MGTPGTLLEGPTSLKDFFSLPMYSLSFPRRFSRSATNSRWMEGLRMSSWYLLNSWRNCSVLAFMFLSCAFSLPAMRFSAGTSEVSKEATAPRHCGSV